MSNVADLTVPFADVHHRFTDRRGGVSLGPLRSLNLAMRGDETESCLVENWRRALTAMHPDARPEDLALCTQVHGADVIEVTSPTGPLRTAGEADALVTARTGVALAVRTADCVPVLFAAPDAIGAAHAGWRGVAAGVVPATVNALADLGAPPGSVMALVGPHIAVDAYEVGEEVVEGVAASGVPESVFVVRRARPHVDLRAAVVHQLRTLGVNRIGHLQRCTVVDETLFSHRRDGSGTGRQASIIGRWP